MFKNVLVGVDGGPHGLDAVTLASHLVDPAGRLTLAHVREGESLAARSVTSEVPIGAREESEQVLERERDAAQIQAELVRIEASSPGRGLHEQAEKQKADLLVVGSCSRGAFGRVMLGDDTRAALNGASCTVAIAALGYAEHPNSIAKVGVGYDGSQESKAALAVARQLAARNATVQALEVVSLPMYAYTGLMPPAIGESLDVLLQQAEKRMKALPDVQARAVYGIPGEELAALGATQDILIVGSRSYGPLGRVVHGSTSDYLQRHARCSLLVLPRVSTADIASTGKVHTDTSAVLAV